MKTNCLQNIFNILKIIINNKSNLYIMILDLIFTLIGIVGFGFVATAIILESFNKLPKDKITFLILNINGSIFLGINAYYFQAYLFVFLNLFMIFANIIALISNKKKNIN